MKSYLTIYDEGVLETPDSKSKLNKNLKEKKEKKEKIIVNKRLMNLKLIPEEFVQIPNCSDYFINKEGSVISIRTNFKFIKKIKDIRYKTGNHFYITIKNDNKEIIKKRISKVIEELFN